MLPIRDHNPPVRPPVVTIALIALNLLAFLYQLTYLPEFGVSVHRLGLVPYELTHLVDVEPLPSAVPPWLALFTSMFLHGGVLHLAGNMLYLWIFGNNVEDTLGHAAFAVFYLGCGLVAAIAHVLSAWNSTLPMVGASGAVAGVLGAYLVLFPRARVDTLVFLIFFLTMVELPAGILLGFWFLLQFLSIGSGGVAWFAHIGGFTAGALVALIYLGAGGKRPAARARPPRGRFENW